MFYFDKIEVDILFPENLNTDDFAFYWYTYVWNETTNGEYTFTSPHTPVEMQTSKHLYISLPN